MENLAIHIDNMSKRYPIGSRATQRNLRETLMDFCLAALRAFRHPLGGLPGLPHGGLAQSGMWALKDVSLEIQRGEIIGLIGRNGAGKSTLLKILSGITKPTAGRAEIYGRVSSLLEVGTGFHPELTGRENIYFNAALLGMQKTQIAQKFDEIVAFSEIGQFLDTPVKRYSSGMYVRLAFSVAAFIEPEILLVDEVLAVGDLAFQKKCLGKMADVSRRGRTIIFVSHQMFAIRSLCQRTVWIDRGQVRQQGPTFEVVRAYEEKLLNASGNLCPVNERPPENIVKTNWQIRRVVLADANGQETCIFSYRSTLHATIEMGGVCRSENYALEFRVYKESGEYACTGVSSLFHDIFFRPGTTRVEIEVGPLILTNGHYTISFRVLTGMRVADEWNHACTFHIVECNPFALRREIRTPVCVVQHRFHALN